MELTTPAPRLLAPLGEVARDIKLSHTIFALPFALLATFMAAAAGDRLPAPALVALIVVCMILARTVAMTMNRWADATLDARNPRTERRAIPAGRVTRSYMLGVAIACGVGFLIATGGFWLLEANPWPLCLSPFVLAWLAGYSFSKRFTWLCHLMLGVALALSPLAAAVAIHPPALQSIEPYLLAVTVACWVAGFDIFYAMQDVDVDRACRLRSIPASLGLLQARLIAAALHLVALAALVVLGAVDPHLSSAFGIATGLVGALLLIEHTLIWMTGTRHMTLAFLTINGIVSLLLGAAGIADIVTGLT